MVVEADPLGFKLVEDEATDLAKLGMLTTKTANEQIGFSHPGTELEPHIFVHFVLIFNPNRSSNLQCAWEN